jgi:hypothetical protein
VTAFKLPAPPARGILKGADQVETSSGPKVDETSGAKATHTRVVRFVRFNSQALTSPLRKRSQ